MRFPGYYDYLFFFTFERQSVNYLHRGVHNPALQQGIFYIDPQFGKLGVVTCGTFTAYSFP